MRTRLTHQRMDDAYPAGSGSAAVLGPIPVTIKDIPVTVKDLLPVTVKGRRGGARAENNG